MTAETIAGERCPCGHLVQRHKKADPDWRVGQMIEIRGACRDCECRGEIAVDPKVLAEEEANDECTCGIEDWMGEPHESHCRSVRRPNKKRSQG